MRGRELADLDSTHRPRHVARAVRFGDASGAGRRRALPASDRRRPLEGAVPQAAVRTDVERCAEGYTRDFAETQAIYDQNVESHALERSCPDDERESQNFNDQ